LKNRKTDLKEQNKRLQTIQQTNACWQITNLSSTYLWCLVSPTHFQRLLMCSNTLPYWCCCLLSKKYASIETMDPVHNPKFYTILFSSCLHHKLMKWLPNTIHEMQIALGNVGNKSHSKPNQFIWLSRYAQKWNQNWHYRSNVSFQRRYYNSQMAKYQVSSAIASW
jgi:hypothetical protein